MKRPTIFRLTAVLALLSIAAILPYLPGPFLKFTIVLAGLAQAPGYLALLLAPIAAVWTIYEWKRRYDGAVPSMRMAPVYMLLIVGVAWLYGRYLVPRFADRSRDQTIQIGRNLITLIEDYKTRTGQYPADLVALQTELPRPRFLGISHFRYNKIGDRYSVSFSQWREMGSLEELVLFDRENLRNHLGGRYGEYDYSFDLCRVKGAFAQHGTADPDWRAYWLD